MLIEFSAENFRSIRERQTLSMVAAPRLRKRNNVFKPELEGENFPLLLKAAVIYGPNASGKSNLLKALMACCEIASRTPSATSVLPLPVVPFKFDTSLAKSPSVFEIHFIAQGLRYQFNLSATNDRIVSERLSFFPKGKEALLYERKNFSPGDNYNFGEYLEGGKELFDTWAKLTGPKTLFIAQAVANSNESLTQLKAPFSWITNGLYSVMRGLGGMIQSAQDLAAKNERLGVQIARFLQDVDVPIARIKSEIIPSESTAQESLFSDLESVFKHKVKPKNKMTLTHTSALGEADISFQDQSEGTKNLIGFWLPWATREPNSFNERRVLIVDELDSSLHPKIVEALVAKHLQAETPSQLIFTTHDTHLMDSKLLRRDQIWITERDTFGATQIRSVHDFEGRESEDVEKRYFEGRYRGLPIVRFE